MPLKSDPAKTRAWHRRSRRKNQLKKSPIRKVSAKRAKENRIRSKEAQERKSHGYIPCIVRSPICTGEADPGVHERLKNLHGGSRLEHANRVDACDQCNGYIEHHSDWAIRNGWTISPTPILHEIKMGRAPGAKVTE